jgi:hypothetical protein
MDVPFSSIASQKHGGCCGIHPQRALASVPPSGVAPTAQESYRHHSWERM